MTDSWRHPAICNSPVVADVAQIGREMPPVFISHSFGSGMCSSRSKSERRSDSITRVFT
jgi:hypothetical protein